MRSIKYHGETLPVQVDPEKTSLLESVHLIYSVKDGLAEQVRSYVINEYSTPVEEPETLRQIETWFFNRYGRMVPCMVITEYGLRGEIYRYDGCWKKTGWTCGYA